MEIQLRVNLETLVAEKVEKPFHEMDFPYTHNGQHMQLADHALAKVSRFPDEEIQISLWHPKTGPETGHVDITVRIWEKTGEVSFCRYHHIMPIEEKDVIDLWPTGSVSLLQVILAIEKYLQENEMETTGLVKILFSPTPTPAEKTFI